jgi:hypothetical protein
MKTFLILFSLICISLLTWFHFKPAPKHYKETTDYVKPVSTILGNWHLLKMIVVSPTETSSYTPENSDELLKNITDSTFENIAITDGDIIKNSGYYKLINDTTYIEYITYHPISNLIGDSILNTVHLWDNTMFIDFIKMDNGVPLKVSCIYTKD